MEGKLKEVTSAVDQVIIYVISKIIVPKGLASEASGGDKNYNLRYELINGSQ